MSHKDPVKNRKYKKDWYRSTRPPQMECRVCKKTKPRQEMSQANSEKRDMQLKICKVCDAAQARGWYAKNKGRKKNYDLKRVFGITLEQYNSMLQEQNNVCAICKTPESSTANTSTKKRALAVDHDHSTGAIRGLLCSNCNKGIGNLKENPTILEAAINYLAKHGGTRG